MAIDIRKPLKKILPSLLKAQEDNLNEADTRQRIVKVLEDVLGYDAMEDVSREQQVKDKYVDFAIKIDGRTRFFIEAKAAGIALRDRHIEQAKNYAANANIRWVLLTNGVAWNLYHLSFEEGIEEERAFAVDLSSKEPIDKAADALAFLHRQVVRKGGLEDFWQHRVALNPESIAKVVFTEEMLRGIRRAIRKEQGLSVDEEDLAHAIHGMFSTEARERIGPLRIRRKRRKKSLNIRSENPEIGKPGQELTPPAPSERSEPKE